ncbi:AAA-domain-containing protein [Xylariaceae sp. FL0255]|nr:AAA-domain-containing protein [Xylariaceae sp. FL0255]
MAPKRKTDLYNFDPNASDSNDENFEPEADDIRRPRKKPRQGRNGRSGGGRRRGDRYHGSDVDDDDEDELSQSADAESFHDSDDEDEEPVLNEHTGRAIRKTAARKTVNYKESSDEDAAGEDSDAKDELANASPEKPSKVVTIKLRSGLAKKAQAIGTRRTRAHTAEADDGEGLVELSNSGRHAKPARGSKSRSPELLNRRRTTRGAKSVKPPSPLAEDTQEELAKDDIEDIEPSADDAMDVEPAATNAEGAEDHPIETVETVEEGDEDDDQPVTRRTRGRGAADADTGNADEHPPEEASTGLRSGRLTRGTRGSKAKKPEEPSSDFEPGNSDEDNDSAAEGQNRDDDSGSQPRRGGKSLGQSRPSSRRPRMTDDESVEEEQLDKEEMAEELMDLREDSLSRKRRRRQETPVVLYEKTRRRKNPVSYVIQPLNQANFDADENEDRIAAVASTPGGRGRGRRAAATVNTSTALHTLAGPFGGTSGAGSLGDGPWGNGLKPQAGNLDSDSSDDEMNTRSGPGGHPPTTPRGLLSAGAQLNGGDGAGHRLGALAPNVGKIKDQKALADADPLGVDLTVSFDQVGGMQGHIEQLKEMVQLPLLYPDMFTRFHVTPPRGVLFHGPPGTGKTLLARALANSVGFGGRKITFYMRKGADALSKWVGEAEKQLRLLFEEARKNQPSIIFFDEIDGLAPVRSSKQEQIHASIVSTLLALMDGMDGRGQVIVIGATNRPDNIDPALRRPGRFDREFYFPLPDVDARKAILDIHTKDWGLSEAFKLSLAKDAKGYGGADLRALCTEAALNSIQRTYPQIYMSKEKLVVDPEKIHVHMTDFMIAKKKIVPSSERSSTSGAASLPKDIAPLLRNQFKSITDRLDTSFPRKPKVTALQEAMYEPYDDEDFGFDREELHREFDNSRIFRPRLLVCGARGMGQSYLSAAMLHYFEGVHVQNFDLPTIIGDSRTPEQVLTSLFTEVKRQKPSVIFIPNVEAWYNSLAPSQLTAFKGMLRSLHPTDPIMVLATAETEWKDLEGEMRRDLFGFSKRNVIEIARPIKEKREEYFQRIIDHIRRLPKDFPNSNRKLRKLEELPVAPPPPEKKLTKEEIHNEDIRYRQALNLMKVHLQPIMDQITKKYRNFRQPVIPESSYQYLLDEAEHNYIRPDVENPPPRPYELAKDSAGYPGLRETATDKFYYNLDVNIIETRLANGYYWRPYEFLRDVRTLRSDAQAIGDKPRFLKADELLSNVEVDVTDVDEKLQNMGFDWVKLYETQKKRREEKEERARKKKAMQTMVDMAQSSLGNSDQNNSNGHTTTAEFQVISDLPNGTTENTSSNAATNGTSIPSRRTDGDVEMSGVDQYLEGQTPLMQPPSQWPRMPPRSLDTSTRVTTGGTAQLSQVSAVQSIPSGVSPSALVNEASSTRTSDPSNRSSNYSTQNGGLYEQTGPLDNMPDTQSYVGASQNTSSDEQWPHSQAQGLKRGLIQQPGFSQGSQHQPSPISVKSSHRPSVANLLNDPSPEEAPQSQRQSQQVELDEDSATHLLNELTKRTSGCTIEQLQQINGDLMSKLWETRGEHNRMKVFSLITREFNDTMQDMEQIQQLLQQSQ